MAEVWEDEEVFEPDAGAADEGGECCEIEGEAYRFILDFREEDFGRGGWAEEVVLQIIFRGDDGVGEVFVFRQLADEIQYRWDVGGRRGRNSWFVIICRHIAVRSISNIPRS